MLHADDIFEEIAKTKQKSARVGSTTELMLLRSRNLAFGQIWIA